MTQFEQEQAAKQFVEIWLGKGDEKSDTQRFWIELLNRVYGVEDPTHFIEFEKRVRIENKSFIDGYIASTKVLIEQKSISKDLNKPEPQSDGSSLTPYGQAKRYSDNLDYNERARWIITCNFDEFQIYDMDKIHSEPVTLKLKDLPKQYYILQFLIDSKDVNIQKEEEISFKAGELVGKLYDEVIDLYRNPEDENTLKSLNMLCVRLVFCLYAEDAGLFGKHNMFHDYIEEFSGEDLREALINLFKILDTKIEDRDPYLKENLAGFPYVNGGLFADENIEIPRLNDKIKDILMNEASRDFDWSDISPTIFGAVFESTLNPETRRSGGMHYTSIENIHKVIDPLFLNELKYELDKIIAIKTLNTRKQKLSEFQDKLSKLKFLDPACGSGNFLTESYLSIRRLENKAISAYTQDQIQIGQDMMNPIKVTIGQFYGIEINDFAATVAKTALWIAESQMFKETQEIINMHENFLPLKAYTHITEGNALRIEWNEVIHKEECSYIMGNPPFIGKKEQSREQKEELLSLFDKNIKNIGNIDYVAGWYKKVTDYIKNTKILCAFVSTNSITQGEQVTPIWKSLFEEGIKINFAYRTFRWDSEATLKAHVHCVIIGFSYNKTDYYLYKGTEIKKVENINPYLIEAPNIFIETRKTPISNVSTMNYGSMPIDNGHLILNVEEKDNIIKENIDNKKFIRNYIGGEELINNKVRYCIWLKDVNPVEVQHSKLIMDRIRLTKEFRESSKRPQTLKAAETPYLFGEIRQPNTDMLVIPKVSSETRKYIPIDFIKPDTIVNGSALIVPQADLYMFGILTSNVHNAWMRTVAGRMKSDYQYSAGIVYNTFVWANPTEKQKEKIITTAQNIFEIRRKYSQYSLAQLYNNLTMPNDLFKAHKQNDAAVMEAYGFDWHKMSEDDCVAELFKMYEKITKNQM